MKLAFTLPHSHLELSGLPYLHSTVAQAFVAGATGGIRVNSSVTILPLHHPVVLAKALSTADWMSGRRITAPFGAGWEAKEFAAFGAPFREPGRMADGYLATMVELWTGESPRFVGRYSGSRATTAGRSTSCTCWGWAGSAKATSRAGQPPTSTTRSG
ncbi:hypothetical protein B2J96_24625 [Mycobacterium shigaense]|nr:hypothetical protein B2J96_24625 [Mycobacterium shigaense]